MDSYTLRFNLLRRTANTWLSRPRGFANDTFAGLRESRAGSMMARVSDHGDSAAISVAPIQ